jgi:hypothetical protein
MTPPLTKSPLIQIFRKIYYPTIPKIFNRPLNLSVKLNKIVLNSRLEKEEQVVAELSLLGISYLSRLSGDFIAQPRVGWALLADLIRQPSSRVRSATIALLLEHPEYSEQMPIAIRKLHAKNRVTLKLFYTAAVYLQRIYFEELKSIKGDRFYWLPDFYSTELNIQQESDPIILFRNLGKRHQDLTGIYVNWVGTYKNVIAHLLNRRKLEMEWSQ